MHDECSGSDVFGSDICTCRPYLIQGIEECVKEAQAGGAGLIVYNRKEGRALGEVTKFLVYNARKRQEGGDQAATYFERTECVAGVQDARYQQLMPDVLHWLGIRRIDRFVSMSNLKYDALIDSGIAIGERVAIPDELVPDDAKVELAAKKAAGYFTSETAPAEISRRWSGARSKSSELDAMAHIESDERVAARSLLTAAAVRERAHRSARGGIGRQAAPLQRRSRSSAGGGGLRCGGDPGDLPDAGGAIPRALAAFRCRRSRPVGRADRARAMARCGGRRRAPPSTWRSCRCCSMPVRDRRGATGTRRPGS